MIVRCGSSTAGTGSCSPREQRECWRRWEWDMDLPDSSERSQKNHLRTNEDCWLEVGDCWLKLIAGKTRYSGYCSWLTSNKYACSLHAQTTTPNQPLPISMFIHAKHYATGCPL